MTCRLIETFHGLTVQCGVPTYETLRAYLKSFKHTCGGHCMSNRTRLYCSGCDWFYVFDPNDTVKSPKIQNVLKDFSRT